ncbi:HRDC domain-containing protein [Halobacillus litoralis]|uniref:Helicase n=1 Tax=Halobacillus litoralis TaxID=45668 RepID=A0A410MFN8_9BACI|nr:HRDC domain-containing protein [Halobacillus litoralis]QAS53485.1 helicase [Halobacillus litoralis]
MSILKNFFNVLTEKREIKEPEIYKESSESSNLITHLTSLSEKKDPNINLKKVEKHLKLFSIGQTGEKNVRFELQNSMLPLVILHNVYLEYEDYHAQLDFVIITHKFIMVLEVKKLFGNIHITDQGDFQRVIPKNNRGINKEGMYSPINQVERHVAILEKLLKDKGIITNLPVKYAVSFANPKTIIDVSKNAPDNIQSSVIRHDQIKNFIKNELEKKSPLLISDQQVYEIADTILEYHKEKTFNLEDYKLDISEVPEKNDANHKPKTSESNRKEGDLKRSLTQFRLRRSKELKVKPYYIFTNKILDRLLETEPRTVEQLLEIEGIGQTRVQEFGKDILSIIKSHHNSHHPGDFYVNKPETSRINSKALNNEAIRAALTAFRSNRSKELNVKPFYIFTNHTVESILIKKPATINELLKIEGIGPKKAEEFGQDILNILKNSAVK